MACCGRGGQKRRIEEVGGNITRALSLYAQGRGTYSQPFMVEHFLNGDPVIHVCGQHALNEVLCRLAYRVPQ